MHAGKTLIARQIGKMLNGKEPKIVNGPEILNKYVGASEENVRNLFKVHQITCIYFRRGDLRQLSCIQIALPQCFCLWHPSWACNSEMLRSRVLLHSGSVCRSACYQFTCQVQSRQSLTSAHLETEQAQKGRA